MALPRFRCGRSGPTVTRMREPYRQASRRPFGRRRGTAAGLGLVFAAGGVSGTAELGRWLLTLAAGAALTGALSVVFRQIDGRRTERDAWHAVLNDLVAASQTVLLARLRLSAHRSARTYQEQLSAMRKHLDQLGAEYEAGYLQVSRQQRLDEEWLTQQLKSAAAELAPPGPPPPLLPDHLANPPRAWLLLQERGQFPRLAALLDETIFSIDAFWASYKLAKRHLESLAGHRPR